MTTTSTSTDNNSNDETPLKSVLATLHGEGIDLTEFLLADNREEEGEVAGNHLYTISFSSGEGEGYGMGESPAGGGGGIGINMLNPSDLEKITSKL